MRETDGKIMNQPLKVQKRRILPLLCVLVTAAALVGCGKEAAFTYLEPVMIEDTYGDMAEYEIYAPKDSSNEDGLLFYSGHGLTFSAHVSDYSNTEVPMEEWLEYVVHLETDMWEEQPSEYMDVKIEEIVEAGEDLYQIVSAEREDVFGIPFEIEHLFYMSMKKESLCVQLHLVLNGNSTDSETELIIDELAQCYGFQPEEIKPNGNREEADEERIRAQQEKDSLPETVLWFNATYAPLTQSNKSFGTNWKLVGGMKASEDNAAFCRQTLENSWEITDAASALETVESLKVKGHREKFRQCMEDLSESALRGFLHQRLYDL